MHALGDAEYALGRGRAEYDRLIEQAEILRPLTERMLRSAGIGAGMHVLDIGCGVGDVSFLVSNLVGAEGSVTGVDLDGDAVVVAEQRRAAQGLTNVSFCQADARSLDSGGVFDAAIGRFVLMYLHDPTEALRLFAERVRPGGILAFCEMTSVTATSAAQQPVLAELLALFTSPAACSPRSSSTGLAPRTKSGAASSTTCARNCLPEPASSRCPGSRSANGRACQPSDRAHRAL